MRINTLWQKTKGYFIRPNSYISQMKTPLEGPACQVRYLGGVCLRLPLGRLEKHAPPFG